MSVKCFCRGRKLAEVVKDLAQQLRPLPKITRWWHLGSSPHEARQQMPQQSQRAFTRHHTLLGISGGQYPTLRKHGAFLALRPEGKVIRRDDEFFACHIHSGMQGNTILPKARAEFD